MDPCISYFIVRRFPPPKTTTGELLDEYCRILIKNKEVYNRVREDYNKYLQSDNE